MNNKDNERITYEEFMTMFKNAPRIAYILYDKAEDEIERLNSIINELEKCLEDNYESTNDIWYVKIINKLKELKKEGK